MIVALQLRARRVLGAGDVAGVGRGRGARARLRILASRSSTSPGRRRRSPAASEAAALADVDLGHGRLPRRSRALFTAYACRAVAIRKLLVANRGEIAAARLPHLPRRLGIATVAVVAPDDRGRFHARDADETVEIASYLYSEEHIRAPRSSRAPTRSIRATASWPRTPTSRRRSSAAGLVLVGPPPEALRAGGDKLEAKRIAREAGVPVVQRGEPDEHRLPARWSRRRPAAAAAACGSSARATELEDAVAAARREAKAAFGDDRVFCERYVERPRHVEIQLLARRARNASRARRARVLDPAPPPEGARGVAVARARPDAARAMSDAAVALRAARSATAAPARPSSCSTAATSTSSS